MYYLSVPIVLGVHHFPCQQADGLGLTRYASLADAPGLVWRGSFAQNCGIEVVPKRITGCGDRAGKEWTVFLGQARYWRPVPPAGAFEN